MGGDEFATVENLAATGETPALGTAKPYCRWQHDLCVCFALVERGRPNGRAFAP
jgi:hypothetical protein